MTRIQVRPFSPTRQHDEDWRAKASCTGYDPELWFASEADGAHNEAAVEYAKVICQSCPVLDTCKTWALNTPQQQGICGGMTWRERCKLFGKTRRQMLHASSGAVVQS